MTSEGAPEHVCRYRASDVLFWISVAGVIILFISLTVGWNDHSLVLGIVSFFVMAYVIFTSGRSALAQARVDSAEIKNTHALVRQCRATVNGIDRALRDPDFDLVRVLLGQLYGRVGVVLTKYGRYMQPEAADIVWEMENAIADIRSKPLQEAELLQFITMAHERLIDMKGKILYVDDRTLGALGNKGS